MPECKASYKKGETQDKPVKKIVRKKREEETSDKSDVSIPAPVKKDKTVSAPVKKKIVGKTTVVKKNSKQYYNN